MSGFKKGKTPHKRQTLKRKHSQVLKKLAIAFAIVLVAAVAYAKLEPYTHDAKIRTELESKSRQLQETKLDLEQTQSKNKKEFEKQQKELKEVQQKLEETEKALQAKRSTPKAYAAERPAFVPSGNKTTWLAASNIPESEWWAVDSIVSRESGWNPCAHNPGGSDCNYKGERACGLAQALPCSKLRNQCGMTDAVCHLNWQYQYVKDRYGGYPQAVAFWNINHWY